MVTNSNETLSLTPEYTNQVNNNNIIWFDYQSVNHYLDMVTKCMVLSYTAVCFVHTPQYENVKYLRSNEQILCKTSLQKYLIEMRNIHSMSRDNNKMHLFVVIISAAVFIFKFYNMTKFLNHFGGLKDQ